jgi:hypothetical protein
MLESDGKPLIGDEAKMLGVRVPPHAQADVAVDNFGMVHPGSKGMSVSPRWQDLPPHLIPKRLNRATIEARGRNTLVCFRFGDGSFVSGEVAAQLSLVVDRPTHGCIGPTMSMTVGDLQMALAGTQEMWIRDED